MYLYTKRGEYHKQRGECSGDVVRGVDNGEFAVLTLADGVSTCRYGADGASLVSACAMDYVYNQFFLNGSLPKGWPVYMLNLLKKRLYEVVNNDKSSYKEYSTTLMVIVIDRSNGIMYYCNIGDSILIAINDDKCPIICMPQGDKNGCPVITTDGLENNIMSGDMNLADVNNIMMCSDGMWRMMYNRNTLKPEIKNFLLSGNYSRIVEYANFSDNIDDCSFAFADVRRVA